MGNAERFRDGYLEAWRTNDADSIRALFAPEAVYKDGANDPNPVIGVDRIVEFWLENRDEPATWSYEGGEIEFESADAAAVRGVTTYPEGRKKAVYDNLWLLRFDTEGRATQFWDWFSKRSD